MATVDLHKLDGKTQGDDSAPGSISERLFFNYEMFNPKHFKDLFPDIELTGVLDSSEIKRTK